MPLPIPRPTPTPPQPTPDRPDFYTRLAPGQTQYLPDPYYVRDVQDWAVEQEHMRHDQALLTVGEYCMWTLMWHVLDFEAGLVQRCQRCYRSSGKIAEAYGQASQNKCPDCFGTTFEGGIRAQIVRPAIFTDTDEEERVDRRGVTHAQNVRIETTHDFRVRSGDYCFRVDGTRWYLRHPESVKIRTGFAYPSQAQSNLTLNFATASLEDRDSVAYLIPPDEAAVTSILGQGRFYPQDFSPYETINAPLIPPGGQP